VGRGRAVGAGFLPQPQLGTGGISDAPCPTQDPAPPLPTTPQPQDVARRGVVLIGHSQGGAAAVGALAGRCSPPRAPAPGAGGNASLGGGDSARYWGWLCEGYDPGVRPGACAAAPAGGGGGGGGGGGRSRNDSSSGGSRNDSSSSAGAATFAASGGGRKAAAGSRAAGTAPLPAASAPAAAPAPAAALSGGAPSSPAAAGLVRGVVAWEGYLGENFTVPPGSFLSLLGSPQNNATRAQFASASAGAGGCACATYAQLPGTGHFSVTDLGARTPCAFNASSDPPGFKPGSTAEQARVLDALAALVDDHARAFALRDAAALARLRARAGGGGGGGGAAAPAPGAAALRLSAGCAEMA
jgi:hypothetical protein